MKLRTLAVAILAEVAFAAAARGSAVGVDGFAISVRTDTDDPAIRISRFGGGLNPEPTARATASRAWTFHRLVADREGRVLFAYTLEVKRGAGAREFSIRLLPLDAVYENRIRAEPWFPESSSLGVNGRLVSFERGKDLGTVKFGDQVRIELFRHQSSGGRIYDVLEMEENPPSGAQLSRKAQSELFFKRLRVLVNGREETNSEVSSLSVTGEAVLIELHPYGRFFFSRTPVAGYAFENTARVEGERLTLHWKGNTYEFVSEAAIVGQPAGPVPLWALVLPASPSDPSFSVASAPDIARLLPRLQQPNATKPAR